MASTPPIFLGLAVVLVISLMVQMANGREVPTEDGRLQPEWLDRSVLIPGIGRVIFPKKRSHVNPITYNPVTGTPSGSTPGVNNGSIGGQSHIPGGDDTILPPVGGEISTPSHP